MDLDAAGYLRFVASLVFVVGLMLALLWALRRFGPAGMVVRPGTRRRLGVIESSALDGRRRLVLVRCDDTEHLLLIGGVSDLVVESRTVAPATEDKA
jgi:flagellar protein FliO/FliZ